METIGPRCTGVIVGGSKKAAQDTGGGHRTQCLPPPQIRCKSLMSPLVHTALLCSAAVRPVSLEPGAKEPIAQLSQRGYIALIAGRVEVAIIVMFTILIDECGVFGIK